MMDFEWSPSFPSQVITFCQVLVNITVVVICYDWLGHVQCLKAGMQKYVMRDWSSQAVIDEPSNLNTLNGVIHIVHKYIYDWHPTRNKTNFMQETKHSQSPLLTLDLTVFAHIAQILILLQLDRSYDCNLIDGDFTHILTRRSNSL